MTSVSVHSFVMIRAVFRSRELGQEATILRRQRTTPARMKRVTDHDPRRLELAARPRMKFQAGWG
jgi:hypothetical protein